MINEDLNVYRKLQEHLDKLPIGYSATKSVLNYEELKKVSNNN